MKSKWVLAVMSILPLMVALLPTPSYSSEGNFEKKPDLLIEFSPDLQVSLYKDWDVENDSKSLTLADCKKKYEGQAACDSTSYSDQIVISDGGKCLRAFNTAFSKFCEGDALRMDGRDFKVTQITDRVMGFTSGTPSYGLTYLMATPLVRLTGPDGEKWIAESESLIPLAVAKNSKKIDAVSNEQCGGFSSVITGIGKACAVRSATENLRGMCSVMKGRLVESSIRTESASCDIDSAFDPEDRGCVAKVSGECDF